MIRLRRLVTVAVAISSSLHNARAQQPIGSVALADLVQGLGVNTRVLVIGAHPDDEDTGLIAWLSRGKHVETAYLSLTRGEGGQNLIGNELGYALGMIRTEELLAARQIDGAHQYFTRAVDFGFSKTFAEADSLWPQDLVLKDVVTVIRAFRPHVIVSVWTGTQVDGHGHHQYSGVIAKEAFDQAADSSRFPASMTSGLPPWTPLKFYRTVRDSTQNPRSATPVVGPGILTVNIGEYSPLFGLTFAELAALSRSQHRSQGMGMILPPGAVWEGEHLDTSHAAKSDSAEHSLFDGIDTTWNRFASVPVPANVRAALDSLPDAIRSAQASYDAATPDKMIPFIGRALRLARLARTYPACLDVVVPQCGGGLADLTMALNTTIDRASRAMVIAAGVTILATSEREQVAINEPVGITVEIYNRGRLPVEMVGGRVTVENAITDLGAHGAIVQPDSVLRIAGRVGVPTVSYPWWLVGGVNDKSPIYNFDDGPGKVLAGLIRGEDRIAASNADFTLRIDEFIVRLTAVPIVYRYADPVRGEQRHPLVSVPKITTQFQSAVEYIRANTAVQRGVRVTVRSASINSDTVTISLAIGRAVGNAPVNLKADSMVRRVVLGPFGSASALFRLSGRVTPDWLRVAAMVTDRTDNRTMVYRQGILDIDYPHIRPIRYFSPPELLLSAVDVRIPANLEVGYVRGVGDDVEVRLEQLGVKSKTIAPDALSILDLTAYNALVIGPRAYEAIDAVAANAAAIQAFARRGGTVVVQYSTIADKPGILPYPITFAAPTTDRVTEEKAEVVFLDSTSRLMTYPNRISHADFDDWGQERALFMPRTFDPHYKTLFSMHDKGDPANSGAVLYTPLGKGMFVYTTLSFFRQLPGGNPGAARLFVNLLSAGTKPAKP